MTVATRTTLVLCISAAALDLPLPSRDAARVRLHLIDRSDSVSRGPLDALRPADADRVRAYDEETRAPGDTVLWASFGKDLAFESTAVDGSATDLAGALEASLARNPTEIILYTDGRADPGRSLLLCRARGVPVHAFPLGGARVHDVRISALSVPVPDGPGGAVTVEATVVSTFDVKVPVRLDREVRELTLTAGVPAIVGFPGRAPGPFTVTVDVEDDCRENNSASGLVLAPASSRRKVLALSDRSLPLPADRFDLTTSRTFADPRDQDVVVLDNVSLSADEQRRLADWVRDFHGGLVLLGGPRSYALGGWKGTPIEEVSPLRAQRDQKVAVMFVIDASGSMHQPGKLDVILEAVREAWTGRTFEPGDYVRALTFPQGQVIHSPAGLTRVDASGGTNIAEALSAARNDLVQVSAPRSQIFLFTDGETSEKETSQMRRDVGLLLERDRIALTVVTVGKEIEIGRQVPLSDWSRLRKVMFDELLPETRESQKDHPGAVVLHPHPVTEGLSGGEIPWMNLTSAKPDAQVVGTVGKAPAIYPAIAFRQMGLGRVGAFAYLPGPELLSRAIEYVAAEGAGGLRLSIDPPVVRARGRDPSGLGPVYLGPGGETGPLNFRQVLSDTWEAPLPPSRPGTLVVRCGAARAAFTLPCAREYEALGIDWKALERIASETGGRVIRSPGELAGLPRPHRPAPRSARALFLGAGLMLLFLDLALSTFWKA
ncbi:MAG TPA: VWA domain-containing protein [Planctomycetota bacterium]|nr:VWA domain-containing protein [Planctomycetota bacterium]